MSEFERLEKQAARPRRLGRNQKGYVGETIEIASVLRQCLAAAKEYGWTCDSIQGGAGVSFPAFRRQGRAGHPRVYISSGIHGDEPAGPLAVLQLLCENRWPPGLHLWLCPCLNPAGFDRNTRDNARGLDLNRQYLAPKAPETIAHIEWLERQPRFDLALCLHEDWEAQGFYVYELNPDQLPSLAEGIVRGAAEVCPVDHSEIIEGRPAVGGIIRPNLDPRSRAQWPEAFYLLMHKTRLSYTLEAPSDFQLAVRVAALAAGTGAALASVASAQPQE